jgi:L-fucose isomerase-like protein
MKKMTGTYEVSLAAEPDHVVAAVEAALKELELGTVTASATKLDGEVSAKTAQDKDVKIKVKRSGEGVSSMSVHVGAFGDETISNAIIAKTKEHLDERGGGL